MCSFKNERYKHVTELSKHIWSLKEQEDFVQHQMAKNKASEILFQRHQKMKLVFVGKIFYNL